MKIIDLEVRNYKSIQYAKLEDLPRTVVVAGPNGSGKSTLLSAITFLKFMVGSYHNNELSQFVGFAGLEFNRIDSLTKLFRDDQVPLIIKAKFSISEQEKTYLREEGRKLQYNLKVRSYSGSSDMNDIRDQQLIANMQFASLNQSRGKENIRNLLEKDYEKLISELDEQYFNASLTVHPNGNIQVAQPMALVCLFSNYIPEGLGSFHSRDAHRAFNRTSSVNVNLGGKNNTANLFGNSVNVKQIIGDEYVRSILSGNISLGELDSLGKSLAELFDRFIPGKRYGGAIIDEDGKLEFPVFFG